MQSRIFLLSTILGVVATCNIWNSSAIAALDCPAPPSQMKQETRIEIEGELGAIKSLLGGSGKLEYEKKVDEIFSRYPNADKIVIINFIISVFCQLLNDSTELNDKEKFQQLFDFSEKVARTSVSEDDDKFPPNAQISALKSAFSGKDPEVVRISLGRALGSPSEFIQNLALKALLGGIKSVYSGELFRRGKSTAFLLRIATFNELDGTFSGEFSGWDEKFEGQLSGITLVFIGHRYTFSVSLQSDEILVGDTFQGCMSGSPTAGCVSYEAARIRLF